MNQRKHFNGGLNADDDFEMVKPEQWINASGIRIGTTDAGATERVEAVGGTRTIFTPAGTNYCIGACEDEAKRRIYWLNCEATGKHGIYCYDKITGNTYTVLTNAQIQGGLNFNKYFRADSIALVGDLIQFTDNYNEPRGFNVEAAIASNNLGYNYRFTYVFPIPYTSFTIVKRPPIYPVAQTKIVDTTFPNNYIQDKAYQFTYRYHYKDYQISDLAAYGPLVPPNYTAQETNAIVITLPYQELIEDEILSIDLLVRMGNIGKTFRIKTWSKDSDAALITAHNSGTPLTFTFYDNLNGEAIDAVKSITYFSNVPIQAKALEVAKSRVFLGNITAGYDTPAVSSLNLLLQTTGVGGSGTYTGQWKYVTLYANFIVTGVQNTYMYPYIQVNTGQGLPSNFYYFPSARKGTNWNGGTDVVPAMINLSEATIATVTEEAMVSNLKSLSYPFSPSGISLGTPIWLDRYEFYTLSKPATINQFAAVAETQFFKSGGSYQVNIAFYDQFKRPCGVNRVGQKITIPLRAYLQSTYNSAVGWTLNNGNPLAEIPSWAYYYQIQITKNLTQRFFVQGMSLDAKYVAKDQAGVYTYTTTYTYATTYAVGIDISILTNYKQGYTFNEGDLINLYIAGQPAQTLRIIGQDGKYIHCSPTFLDTLPISILFEIYTPYISNDIEPYYGTGPVYNIINPTTPSRNYATQTGTINGDCYAIQRKKDATNTYIVEAMSPNDKVWKIWNTDTGFPNIVDTIGQKKLTNTIVFSDTIIVGAKVNGLNSFQPLNQVDLDLQNGPITKLQLANKIQQDGTVVLAICENETVSCYLGETELFDSKGSAYVAKSDSVIGTTKALQGSMGSRNAESVFDYNGLVFFYDGRNGCFVQYSSNGLFPISKNKLVRATKLFSKDFNNATVAQIEALGSHKYVIGGFDPYHKELLFSLPATAATPPKGFLVDYPTIVYPFDIYDGTAKTIMYKHEADFFLGSIPIEADKFVVMDNDLYSIKNGALHIHNQSNTCNFYGTQYTAKIMVANTPGGIHTFQSIGVEGNKTPAFVLFRTFDPFIQSSDLIATDFKSKEGVKYSAIYRDRLSPNASGNYVQKQFNGDTMKGKTLLTMLEFEFVKDPAKLALRFSDTGNTINQGHLLNDNS